MLPRATPRASHYARRAAHRIAVAPVEQVVEPQTAARSLGGVDGPHALQCRAVGRVPRADEVEQLVVRADEMDVANEEPVHVLHVCQDQLRDLTLHEGHGIHDALGSNHVDLPRGEQARRAEMEVVLVASLTKNVDARHHLDCWVACDSVNRLALALVAKISARHEDDARLIDQRVEDLLHRCLFVARARHVVEFRQPLQSFDCLIADCRSALLGAARETPARRWRKGRLKLAVLLVALLILLVIGERRLAQVRRLEHALPPQPLRVLEIALSQQSERRNADRAD
eukprot:scaffold15540_cov31-Tisochrysis_lutea.AAC.1